MTAGGGYIADPKVLEALLGRKVHPWAYRLEPQGARLCVVLDQKPDQIGTIVIPEEYKRSEQMGAGVVVSVGALVGQPAAYPGAPQIDEPKDLLYRHVLFGMHGGKGVSLPPIENARDFDCNIVILSDRDIHFIDWDWTGNAPSSSPVN